MGKWEKVRLKDCFTLSSGKFLPAKNRIAGAYDVFGGNGITGKHNEYFIEEPTVVIGRVGEYCGSVHITSERVWVTDNALYVTKFLKEIDRQYLCYALNQRNLNKYSNKSGQPSISQSAIANIEILLPPFEVQKQIVEVLDSVSKLLAMRKLQHVELNNLIKSTFIEMFGDPSINEKGWSIVKLSDFYENQKSAVKCGPFGSALKKEEYVGQGVPVWVMDNITRSGEFIDEVQLYISEEKFKELEQYNVKQNDIIISRAGTVGKMCVVTADHDKSVISTNLIRVRLNRNILPLYIVKLITIWGSRVCRLKTGGDGAFTHMNTGVLDNIMFPHPPLSLQNQFANIVTEIEEQKALVKKAIDETKLLFDSLMSQYFD